MPLTTRAAALVAISLLECYYGRSDRCVGAAHCSRRSAVDCQGLRGVPGDKGDVGSHGVKGDKVSLVPCCCCSFIDLVIYCAFELFTPLVVRSFHRPVCVNTDTDTRAT